TKCSDSDGWVDPAPTVTVTSNHCPRFTESGASILGVCFSSYDRRTSRNSGVNCSACPSAPTRAVVGTRASTARTTTTPDVFPYLYIPEDEVGQLALRHGDPLLAIRRLQQPVGRPAQQLPDDLPVVLVVLDVEHRPLVHPRPPSACRGTVKKKVDPLPSSLSTQ